MSGRCRAPPLQGRTREKDEAAELVFLRVLLASGLATVISAMSPSTAQSTALERLRTAVEKMQCQLAAAPKKIILSGRNEVSCEEQWKNQDIRETEGNSILPGVRRLARTSHSPEHIPHIHRLNHQPRTSLLFSLITEGLRKAVAQALQRSKHTSTLSGEVSHLLHVTSVTKVGP